MIVGRHLRVSGRVQGVFFRQWTVEQARELGVAGWVRNCPNGTVEARLSGEEGAVAALIERIRRGPPAAEVATLRIDEVPPENGEGFEVKRGQG
jgi:acylphosphatase